MKIKRDSQIKRIENLDLTVDEIEKLLDSASITDELTDFVAKKYEEQIKTNDSFKRIRDIINLVDLTIHDENSITSSLSEAAKRSFFSLAYKSKLSRPEIVYYVKKDLVNDDDIKKLFETKSATNDLIEVLLRWKPELFENLLKPYCKQYMITSDIIENAKQRMLKLEKFNFLID
jgi:hypothetical protein